MKKPKVQTDKILFDSPILDEGVENTAFSSAVSGLAISGELSVGKNGHPVTILVEDEETGEMLEVNHVRSALLVIEDSRKSSNGWLSVVVGDLMKLNSVLAFLSKLTLEGLAKLARSRGKV